MKRRGIESHIEALEAAEQPGRLYELMWSMTFVDYAAFEGKGAPGEFTSLMEAAGLNGLTDGEKIVALWIDVADGGPLESHAPTIRRVRYVPRGGWGPRPMVHVLGHPGQHVRDLEPVPGDPWPEHWPAPSLPSAPPGRV